METGEEPPDPALYLPEAGYYEYEATAVPQPGEDGWKENNRAIADLLLKGEGRVLVVAGPDGKSADTDGLVAALKASRQRGGNDRQPRPAQRQPRVAPTASPW
ncbi:MAG: hypothetical protein U1G05_05515 [Kiritimatiellia bacterium]